MIPEQLEPEWLPEGPARALADARDLHDARADAMADRAAAEGKRLPRGVPAAHWWPHHYGLTEPPIEQIDAWSNGGGAIGEWARARDRLEQSRADRASRSAIRQASEEEGQP